MSLVNIAAGPLAASGLPLFIRRFWFKRAVTFLNYHEPAPHTFDSHITWLNQRYSIISIGEAVRALETRQVDALRDYPLVITIDDGHKSNVDLLPVIRKHGIRPCIYLCSAIVGTNRPFADVLVSKKFSQYRSQFKRQDEKGRREMFRQLCDLELESELPEPMGLSRTDLTTMVPYVDFGSHGRFHQSMPFLSDNDLDRELFVSKAEIEAITEVPCEHFAFPSGLYDERTIEVAKKAGYRSVRSIDAGPNRFAEDVFRLRITGASDDASIAKLDVQSVGIYRIFKERLAEK